MDCKKIWAKQESSLTTVQLKWDPPVVAYSPCSAFLIVSQVTVSTTAFPLIVICSSASITVIVTIASTNVELALLGQQATLGQNAAIVLLPLLIPRNKVRGSVGLTFVP